MADELVDILNHKGELTGEVQLKSKAHESGLWHASAQVWICTPEGKILLQKRTLNKDTYPGLWDISVAGHLSVGDTKVSAALREIKEEIGLDLKEEDLIFLKTIKRQKKPNSTTIDNEFNHLFLVKYPIELSVLSLQQSEVAAVRLIDIESFKKELIQYKNTFVPHGDAYYSYIISEIQKRT